MDSGKHTACRDDDTVPMWHNREPTLDTVIDPFCPFVGMWPATVYLSPVSPLVSYNSYPQAFPSGYFPSILPQGWGTFLSSPPPKTTPAPVVVEKQAHRKSKKQRDRKKCPNCGVTNTPTWRRGTLTTRLLCNACGLYEKVNHRPRVVLTHPDGSVRVSRSSSQGRNTLACARCQTGHASQWRHQGVFCDYCVDNKVYLDESLRVDEKAAKAHL